MNNNYNDNIYNGDNANNGDNNNNKDNYNNEDNDNNKDNDDNDNNDNNNNNNNSVLFGGGADDARRINHSGQHDTAIGVQLQDRRITGAVGQPCICGDVVQEEACHQILQDCGGKGCRVGANIGEEQWHSP